MTRRAVIFDMDGCLVDSELLSLDTLAALMADHGVHMGAAALRRDCLGVTIGSIAGALIDRGVALDPAAFAKAFEDRLLARYALGLSVVPGVPQLLAQLQARGIAMAIATGSSERRLAATLRLTGLAQSFAGRAFSAERVARGKPAPDVFLLAAAALAVPAADCAVMEDSPHGIQGARAAGMRAIGFTGGRHLQGVQAEHAALLLAAGADAVLGDLDGMAAALLE